MPANLTVPSVSGNYPVNAVNVIGYDWNINPPGGPKRIPFSIAWGGAEVVNNACTVNLTAKQGDFDRIRGMYVDNTQSGADIQIIFQQSGFEFTVAAGEKDYFAVAATELVFYVVSSMALATDATFFQVFNFTPFPMSTYKSVFMSGTHAAQISLTGSSDTTLIAPPVNGTFTGGIIQVNAVSGGDATTLVTMAFKDGNGNVIGEATLGGAAIAAQIQTALVYIVSSVNVRFQNGLEFSVAKAGTAFTGGFATANAYTRTP